MSDIVQAMKDAVDELRRSKEDIEALTRKTNELQQLLSRPKQPRSTRKMSVRLSLKESNTVVRKVTGRFEGEFDITIRQPTAAERMEIRGLATAENYGEIRKLRHSFVVGWSGLLDDDGNEIPFNVRTHEMVLRIQPIQDGIYQTVINYFEESESILTDDVKKKSNGPLESIATVDPPTL